jgi:hypothetical protein
MADPSGLQNKPQVIGVSASDISARFAVKLLSGAFLLVFCTAIPGLFPAHERALKFAFGDLHGGSVVVVDQE